jgi:hypothetical protein
MIKSNSPYYITIPFVSTSSGLTSQNYELSVWVWNGLKSTPPTTASYTTTKGNPTASTGYDTINIARIVNDYIEFEPQQANGTSVINGKNQQWVKTSAQITTLTVATAAALGSSSCLLTLNGTVHTVPITSLTTTLDNALDIKNYVDALPDYSATLSNSVVTITAATNEIQSATAWSVGTAAPMVVNVLTVQAGSAGAEAPQYETTNLMSLGYSYGDEGLNNTSILNNTLIPTQDYKVYRAGNDVDLNIYSARVIADGGVIESLSCFTIGQNASPITVISYPNNQINYSSSIPSTTSSSNLVKYIWVQCDETTTDNYIEVVFNGQTTTLLIQDEPKYSPIDIFFQNKEGAEQVLTFFKEQKSELSITSSEFESDRGQPSTGNHQFVRYNVQGRKGLTLNSGFVDEEMNEIFTQLLLSERIWQRVSSFSRFIPLNIKSKQISYKTQLNERLINYEIKFEYSYNEINNI